MNEDIKKYEAKKGKSREEILQAEKTNKKRTTYIHWIVTFSLIIVTFIYSGYYENSPIGTTFLDNILGNTGLGLLIMIGPSFFIWLILNFFTSISFSKILMWYTIIVCLWAFIESIT